MSSSMNSDAKVGVTLKWQSERRSSDEVDYDLSKASQEQKLAVVRAVTTSGFNRSKLAATLIAVAGHNAITQGDKTNDAALAESEATMFVESAERFASLAGPFKRSAFSKSRKLGDWHANMRDVLPLVMTTTKH